MRPVVSLARDLIRAHSPSGRERPAAEVLLAAFGELGFDRTYLDDAGNAVGLFERGSGPHVMLNGHIDTVPLGDETLWPHPPLSGAVADGRLWGRGASDMKSSLAAMALAAAEAIEAGFSGTLSVTGVVQEEIGGVGARHLATTLHPDVVVLGEPSGLTLKLGHRGRIEALVSLPGAIAHAAKAELGDNALYRAARFLARLETMALPQGGPLGGSTATPTGIRSFPEDGANVVPGRAEIIVDYRFVPDDPAEAALARLAELDPEANVRVPDLETVSWRGLPMRYPKINPAYLAPGESRAVNSARTLLRTALEGLGRSYREGVWWFATDAPFLAESGAVVVGFGPGEEELAHTTRESISLADLEASLPVYRELVLGFGREGAL